MIIFWISRTALCLLIFWIITRDDWKYLCCKWFKKKKKKKKLLEVCIQPWSTFVTSWWQEKLHKTLNMLFLSYLMDVNNIRLLIQQVYYDTNIVPCYFFLLSTKDNIVNVEALITNKRCTNFVIGHWIIKLTMRI